MVFSLAVNRQPSNVQRHLWFPLTVGTTLMMHQMLDLTALHARQL
jgi:hypothetical protein